MNDGSHEITLLTQEELPRPLNKLTRKYLLNLCRDGALHPMQPIRLTAYSEPLFRSDEVEAFMAAKLGLEAK